MGVVPNDTTKFDLAFLIIWIIVSFVLLVLAALRKLSLPNLIKGGGTITYVFAFLQLAIFALFLAALADDDWSRTSVLPVDFSYGVVRSHKTGSQDYASTYGCASGLTDDQKNYCNTFIAAGAWVLIFGLIGIIVSAALTLAVVLSAAGVSALGFLNAHVPTMSNIQWICLQAMLLIWAVSAHNNAVESSGSDKIKLGASWAICFADTVLAIVAALFFAGGAGSGGVSAGPSNTAAVPA